MKRDYTCQVVNNKGANQTACMHNLICVFVVPRFLMIWLICLLYFFVLLDVGIFRS